MRWLNVSIIKNPSNNYFFIKSDLKGLIVLNTSKKSLLNIDLYSSFSQGTFCPFWITVCLFLANLGVKEPFPLNRPPAVLFFFPCLRHDYIIYSKIASSSVFVCERGGEWGWRGAQTTYFRYFCRRSPTQGLIGCHSHHHGNRNKCPLGGSLPLGTRFADENHLTDGLINKPPSPHSHTPVMILK